MSKDSVDQWDTTAANNTDVGGISLAESVMKAPAVNNAFREVMSQVWAWFKSGNFFLRDSTDETKKLKFDISALTTATTRTITVPDSDITLGNLASSSTDNAIVRFDGTSGAMQNSTVTVSDAGAVAASSLSLTTALPVSSGGTGAATLTGLVKGNGTSAMTTATAGTDYYAPSSTDVAIADGGTGASTAATALSNLGALPLAGGTMTGGLILSGVSVSWATGGSAISESGDALFFQNAANGYRFDSDLFPVTSGGGTLGNSTLAWSGIGLSSGAAINFAAGDVTITHSSDTLTFAGATYSFDGLIATNGVLRTGATGTGTGGSVQVYDDGGTRRWLIGLLGSAGETSLSIYDFVSATVRLSINSSGLVTIGAGALAGGPVPTSSTLPVGWWGYIAQFSGSAIADGGTTSGANMKVVSGGSAQSGTWKNISGASVASGSSGIFVRTA